MKTFVLRAAAAGLMAFSVTFMPVSNSRVSAMPATYAGAGWDCLGIYDACMFFYGDDGDWATECESEAQECNRDVVDSFFGTIDMWE